MIFSFKNGRNNYKKVTLFIIRSLELFLVVLHFNNVLKVLVVYKFSVETFVLEISEPNKTQILTFSTFFS